jgi:branched-chain amino acid transport system substrate-binding protein
VPHPGNEQGSQWLTIHRIKPDWVILRGWGVMNPVALKSAQKVGFPADHIIGNIWSNSEEDARPAGDAAKGFISITTHPSGTGFPVIQAIDQYVIKPGNGNLKDPARFGTVYYNLGVVNGILNVEALRVAQAKFGNKPLTGEQVRWGLENLKLDDKRIKEIGLDGLIAPLTLSCADHEGASKVRIQQWDGKKWTFISDWLTPDQKLLRPMVEESAAKYAKEKNLTLRDCAKES